MSFRMQNYHLCGSLVLVVLLYQRINDDAFSFRCFQFWIAMDKWTESVYTFMLSLSHIALNTEYDTIFLYKPYIDTDRIYPISNIKCEWSFFPCVLLSLLCAASAIFSSLDFVFPSTGMLFPFLLTNRIFTFYIHHPIWICKMHQWESKLKLLAKQEAITTGQHTCNMKRIAKK